MYMATASQKKAEPKQAKLDTLIQSIEKDRGSRVIVYMTGDRPSAGLPVDLSTKVAMDVLPMFSKILEEMGSQKKITLLIYTNGGQIEAPWPLVNHIRDYCETFEVVVLKKALSAGTLISLGADKIVMPKGSFLSPVDPATTVVNGDTPQPLEIENIIGFIDFAKDKVGINDQTALSNVLSELSKEVNPSLIGSINRTHSLVRRLALKLLDLHKKKLPEHQLKTLIEHLTEKLFSHTHLISSREAKEIGFGGLIEEPEDKLSKQISALYEGYSELMKLATPLALEPATLESTNSTKVDEKCITAVIHSTGTKYNFKNDLTINVQPSPGGPQININMAPPQWVKE